MAANILQLGLGDLVLVPDGDDATNRATDVNNIGGTIPAADILSSRGAEEVNLFAKFEVQGLSRGGAPRVEGPPESCSGGTLYDRLNAQLSKSMGVSHQRWISMSVRWSNLINAWQ